MHAKIRRALKGTLKPLMSRWPLRDVLRRLFPVFLKTNPPTREMCRAFAQSLDAMGPCIDAQLVDELWERLDPVYTAARRQLFRSRPWRYGPLCVKDNAETVFRALAGRGASMIGKRYCDLGCGVHHPYGASAVMYLNGAASTVAVDVSDTDERRAAEALGTLLRDCLAAPDAWCWSGLDREAFLARVRHFDLRALQDGDMQLGLGSAPLRHVISDIRKPTIEEGSVDIMSSRAVLEHFFDFDLACRNLWTLMSRGGLGYHLADLMDHRAYVSTAYHWWSFLAQDEHWSDGFCNRLRAGEIRASLENAGFEILACDVLTRGEMPAGFRKQLKGRFASMPDEELSALRVAYLVRKP